MLQRIFISVFILFPQIIFAQSSVDSLLFQLEKANDFEKIRIYNEIGKNYIQTDTSKVAEYTGRAKELAIENHDKTGQAKAEYLMGEVYYFSGLYLKSVNFYQKALELYFQLNDTIQQVETCNSIGLSYFYLQKFELAIDQYFIGLRLAECIGDKVQVAQLNSNIAMVYSKIKDYQTAANYYQKALEINTELQRIQSVGINLNGIGVAYYNLENYDSSKVYYFRALKVFRSTNNREHEAILLNNIANIYLNLGDSLDMALKYYIEAKDVFTALGNYRNTASAIEGIGSVFQKMKRFRAAIDTYLDGIKLISQHEPDYALLQLYYSDLASTYEEMGNFKQAFQYEKIQGMYADSLLNTERINQISTLEKQFENEKKEAEIGRLVAENKLSLEIQKKDRYLKLIGFLSAAFLLIALFYLMIRYAEKKKINKVLAEKNRLIKESEDELRALNASKNKFFSIIAHDLKSPFHTVMGYSQLLSKDYDSFKDDDRKIFASNINKSANTIFRLLSNLLEWSRAQSDRLSFNPIDFEFALIYNNVINLLKPNADQKELTLKANFEEGQYVFSDPVMLETVLRNLIGNAIKYSEKGGEIRTFVNRNNSEVQICVEDDGTGIKPEDLYNLFHIDSKVKQKGTFNEDGSGIGLLLCKELVDKHRGRIWAESNLGKGSRFYVSLPLPAGSDLPARHQSKDTKQRMSFLC